MKTRVEIIICADIESKNQLDYEEKRDVLVSELENIVYQQNHDLDECTLESEYEV